MNMVPLWHSSRQPAKAGDVQRLVGKGPAKFGIFENAVITLAALIFDIDDDVSVLAVHDSHK